jgi:bacillithiol biosynthesis cysteine-adding enzyme BshC
MEIVDQIVLENSSFVPLIVKDYLQKDTYLKDFVSQWHETNGLEKAIQNKVFDSSKRQLLVQHLRTQYQTAGITLAENSLVQTNLNTLLGLQTFTITTGHQLSLFGGTLFMSYKILSAIKLALELNNRFPQNQFVPVLWLASEDHDFDEIKTSHLFGKNITWTKDSESMATGKISLQDIAETVDAIGQLLGDKEQASFWFNQIREAYLREGNLGEATLRFYHQLFEAFGLLILDPNAKELKKALIPVMKADLLRQETFAVQQVSDKVLETRYKLQINARPCNFFYIDERSVRKMIKKNDAGGFSWGDTDKHWSAQEMEDTINQYPERFSPNVNVRPVYQEMILPNLAYFGGPAEVAYWLQLKSVFDHFQVTFPLVGLRYMNVIVPQNLQDKVVKLGLTLADLLLSESALTEKYLKQVQGISISEKFESILNSMQDLVDNAKQLDVNLGKEMLEFKLQSKEFFKGKSGAFKKAAAMQEEAQLEKLLKLRARLFPSGILQERIETLMQQEVTLNKAILESLLQQVQVFSGKMDITLS